MEITAAIDRIDTRPGTMMGVAQDAVLRDVADPAGLPLPDGIRVGYGGRMRALDLRPGEPVALTVARLEAFDGHRERIGADLEDVIASLRSLPAAERVGVTFRLVRPTRVRRIAG
jgi:hypothetical protein